MTDQIALNVLVDARGFACEPLPSRCNWPVHHATPAWDAERALFVQPAMPYDPLGILHMTIYTKRLVDPGRTRDWAGPHDGSGPGALVALARPNGHIASIGMRPSTPFLKMHGLGNDFVVLDARRGPRLAVERRRDRRPAPGRGLRPADRARAADRPRRLTSSCASTIRTAAKPAPAAMPRAASPRSLMGERKTDQVTVQTISGLLELEKVGEGVISVDMGPAKLDWRRDFRSPAPATPITCRSAQVRCRIRSAPAWATRTPPSSWTTCRKIPLAELGPKLEHDPFFPERANIGVAQMISREKMKLRVWERGAGLTLACGSGACAAVVAASRRGLVNRKAERSCWSTAPCRSNGCATIT